MIERKIVIGLISSTEYCNEILPLYRPEYIESSSAREIIRWVVEYYNQYKKAPLKDIETIFYKKIEEGVNADIAEEFEEDIFPSLSEEFTDVGLDDFLFDETIKHFQEVQYKHHAEELLSNVENDKLSKENKLDKIKELVEGFNPLTVAKDDALALHTEDMLSAMDEAFQQTSKPVVVFPKELGVFWNEQLVEGGFIGLLAPEKRGKSWLLLEIGMRAARQGKNVIMYQAGDMNQAAQLRRIAIYLNRRSNNEKYCGEHLQPVRDCLLNQANQCNKKERDTDEGVGAGLEDVRKMGIVEYKDLFKNYPDHVPCHNCEEWTDKKLGVPWFKHIAATSPITLVEAKDAVGNFFKKNKGTFYLSTHANGTLKASDIYKDLLQRYEKDKFVPHLVLIDYMDILAPESRGEFRQQENEKWKVVRKISQTEFGGVIPLVVAPTQADGQSYKQDTLNLSNYSEDKRKYAHVTAFYGLNQDAKGREKGLGMLRMNELMLREGDFSNSNQITLLQDLRIGRPYIGAFWGGDNKRGGLNTSEED